jgi:hypothetical protein
MGHLALFCIEIVFLKKEIGGVFTRFKSRNVWQPRQLLMSKDMNEKCNFARISIVEICTAVFLNNFSHLEIKKY